MRTPLLKVLAEDEVSEPAKSILVEIQRIFGRAPNLFGTAAHSPPALTALWRLAEEEERMSLSPRLRLAIALRVAQLNGCDYCLSVFTARAEEEGIENRETADYRHGISSELKEQVLLALVSKVVKDHGQHGKFMVEASRRVGVTDREIVEVISLTALNTWMNYLCSVANTVLDFPAVKPEIEKKEISR